MVLLVNNKVARLLAWSAQGKNSTAYFSNANSWDSTDWKLEPDGLLSCDVEGVRGYWDPEHIVMVRSVPTS